MFSLSIIKRTALLAAALLTAAISIQAQIAESPAAHAERMAWWREARFGMFIHWGPVSLTGQEISWSRANTNTNCPNNGPIPADEYDHLYERFNPTNFDARDWVGTAKSAGMKYMVLTAKHGDGFLLWNSKVDGYNIGATPFHRDVCGELAAAAHRQGVKLGWYFSPMDWHDPDCRSANNTRFVRKDQAELRELLSNYGKIAVLWFDCDGLPAMWDPEGTYALVRGLQPKIVIDNRLQMGTHEQWLNQGHLLPNEDYYTPEQRIGAFDDQVPWETCMTLGTQWSWKPGDKIKTADRVLQILAECAGGDGNLLLDVGPMPDGRIEPRQVEVLRQIGAWLAKNGASIYGTRGGPWKPSTAVASTRQGNTIYVHVLHAQDAAIELPDISVRLKSATLLDGTPVSFSRQNGKLILSLPAGLALVGDTVVKLALAGSAMDIPAVAVPPAFHATASNVFQNDEDTYGPQFAFDGDPETRWATDGETRQAWIAIEYSLPRTVGHVHISEAYPNRVQSFVLQYRNGGDWKPIFAGTTLGDDFQRAFAAVTAREFRLNILNATEGPTINEIELRN